MHIYTHIHSLLLSLSLHLSFFVQILFSNDSQNMICGLYVLIELKMNLCFATHKQSLCALKSGDQKFAGLSDSTYLTESKSCVSTPTVTGTHRH